MKKLLNTLYVTSENSYLALDGENIVIYEEQEERGRLPLHNLEGIVSFGYRGTSPALMGACADRNISLCYVTPQGRFLARVTGKVREMYCCVNSSMKAVRIMQLVWRSLKIALLERFIMRDGCWKEQYVITHFRLMLRK